MKILKMTTLQLNQIQHYVTFSLHQIITKKRLYQEKYLIDNRHLFTEILNQIMWDCLHDRQLNLVIAQMSLAFLQILFLPMAQKKNKKTQKRVSPTRTMKNVNKNSNQKKGKTKKVASLLHKVNNRLFQSVGAISFENKKIKHVLSEKSEPKSSSTQRDASTGIFEEIRPNRQYYGQQTTLYINNKHHSSPNHCQSLKPTKTKRARNDKAISKILRSYRLLQVNHSEELSLHSYSAKKIELHRLRRIQQCELRRQIEKLVEIQQKIINRRK